MYIGVAGNIGCGKTTLTQMLTEAFGWKAQYELADDNPYLADFYADMKRWAFNLQVYFLTKRFQSVQRIRWSNEIVVQDRTMYEDAYVFADNLYHMGLIDDRDFASYIDLFKTMNTFIPQPDLLIYLRASVPTLEKQIKQRNRTYELGIRPEYLQHLNDRYEAWIDQYQGEMIIIDADNVDFIGSIEDRNKTLGLIERTIKSKIEK